MASGSAEFATVLQHREEVLGTGVFSSDIYDELQTLIGVPPPHQPLHPFEAQCLQMIGLIEAPLKARPDVAILAHRTKITQRHVQ
jgi:hypothetical protein